MHDNRTVDDSRSCEKPVRFAVQERVALLFCRSALSVYRPRAWPYITVMAAAIRPGKIILCVANANRIPSETKRFLSFLLVFLMNKL